MKILLTGATGFIGHQLVARLCQEHQLTILTRSPAKAHQLLGGAHQYLAHLSGISELNKYDAIINLAGEPIANKRWSVSQKQMICNSRWDITARLTELCLASETPPSVFISGSAIGIYGHQGSTPIDESYDLTPLDEPMSRGDFPHQVCARWEKLAQDAASEHTRVCILRTGLVLGLSGGAMARMLTPFKLGLGGPIGNGQQGMSWIHQDDIVALIQFLLTEQCSGVYNATAPTPVSNYKFAKLLGLALSRPALVPMPAIVLKLALGEMSQLLTEGQYILPTRALEAGFTFRYPKLEQAFSALLDTAEVSMT